MNIINNKLYHPLQFGYISALEPQAVPASPVSIIWSAIRTILKNVFETPPKNNISYATTAPGQTIDGSRCTLVARSTRQGRQTTSIESCAFPLLLPGITKTKLALGRVMHMANLLLFVIFNRTPAIGKPCSIYTAQSYRGMATNYLGIYSLY